MIINAAGDEVAQVFDEDAAKVICAAPEIIEAADAAYNSWSGGEPIDADMRNLGSALGMEPAP